MKSNILFSVLILVVVLGLFGSGAVQAQSIFLEPNNTGSIHLEALRLGYSGVNFTDLSFAFFLSARIPVGDGLQVRAEVPYATYKLDDTNYYYDPYTDNYYGSSYQSKSGIGNPYVGLDAGDQFDGFCGEFGVRIPVVGSSSDIGNYGVLSDPVERLEAFAPEILPMTVGGNYRYRSGNGFAMRLRLAPIFWLPVGDNNSDADLFVLYSAQAWYEDKKVGVGGGFSGRMFLTNDADGLGDRTLHQFGFFANYYFGKFMPGFQVRFPLDADLKDGYGGIGMSPSYSLSIGIEI